MTGLSLFVAALFSAHVSVSACAFACLCICVTVSACLCVSVSLPVPVPVPVSVCVSFQVKEGGKDELSEKPLFLVIKTEQSSHTYQVKLDASG